MSRHEKRSPGRGDNRISLWIAAFILEVWYAFFIMPLWSRITAIGLIITMVIVTIFGAEAFFAPIATIMLQVKLTFIDPFFGLVAKAAAPLKSGLIKVAHIIAGISASLWKNYLINWVQFDFTAWFAKKGGRIFIKSALTFVGRWALIKFLVTQSFGKERRGVRRLPGYVLSIVECSPIGYPIRWWKRATERQKRLAIGIVLCVILSMLGHAVMGFSILVADFIWEIILRLWVWIKALWRWILPIILRMIPGFMMKLFSSFAEKVIRLLPIVRNNIYYLYVVNFYRTKISNVIRRLRRNRVHIRRRARAVVPTPLYTKAQGLLNAASKNDMDKAVDHKEGGKERAL